jgi:prepilin-type processing-associated H-X9-DG protein
MHFAIARHGKGINVAYFDHSVRSTRSPKQIWSMKWHRSYQRHGFERTKRFSAWLGN